MGKFQTFSSGDEILEQILKSNNFIKIYELHEDLQVSICVEGVLKKSKMKKYDIETDSQQNIFKLP